MKNRRIKHNNRVIVVSQHSELNMPKTFISLPYVPILWEMLRILRKHNIDACFQSVRPLGSFLNSRKDLTWGDLLVGWIKFLILVESFILVELTNNLLKDLLSITTQ